MRKPIALLFAAALILSVAGMANAAIYTWTLIEGDSVALNWPNEANSPNVFEANGGLLGRIIADTDAGVANVCELAPSYPCAALNPPVFLLPAGTAEGPSGAGGGDECNRVTIACGHTAPAAPDVASHPFLDTRGVYSYLVIHTAAQGTVNPGKGIGFFSGSFVTEQDAYVCNDCPPTGKGHDENVGNIQCTGVGTPHSCCTGVGTGNCDFLSNTTIGAVVRTLSSSLWLTQSTPPFGHASVRLQVPPFAAGAGAGEISVCGNGLTYQDLTTDLCSDGIEVGGNFTIPNQKTVSNIYSITCAGKCNGPDCYIQNVIIPAAQAQAALSGGTARNVQVLSASSILPADAPGTLANGSVDSLLFMYTTQEIDFDLDTVPDSCDPCPMDPSDTCLDGSPAGLTCLAGEVLCSDFDGNLACLPAYQCNVKGDLNGDCTSDLNDRNLMEGTADGAGGLEHFNTTLPIGPFDP
jgi:hypothetical protein